MGESNEACANALTIEDLSVSYGGRKVIDGVNLRVRGGEIYVLLGKNGAGKSTLLRAVAGLLRAERGRISLYCVDYSRLETWERRFALFVSPYPLVRAKSVRDNMLLVARLRGLGEREARKEVEAVAEKFGVTHLLERGAGELSMGERQRVGLAITALSKPRVLLVDEPFNHLTREWAMEVARELRGLVKELGIPAIAATPRLDDAIMLGLDLRAGVLYEGKILAEDFVEGLLRRPPHVKAISSLDIYSNNLLDLGDGIASHLGVSCKEGSRYAWVPPWNIDVDGQRGVEAEVEGFASGPLGVTTVLKVGERRLEAFLDNARRKVRVAAAGYICYNEEGRRA